MEAALIDLSCDIFLPFRVTAPNKLIFAKPLHPQWRVSNGEQPATSRLLDSHLLHEDWFELADGKIVIGANSSGAVRCATLHTPRTIMLRNRSRSVLRPAARSARNRRMALRRLEQFASSTLL